MMTFLKHVLVLLLFAQPILISAHRSGRAVKASSNVKSSCKDWQPNWCKTKSEEQPIDFAKDCGTLGSKFGFCCETCNDFLAKGEKTGTEKDGETGSEVTNLKKRVLASMN